MAYSQREILAKIGDLLVEINEDYAAVEQNTEHLDSINLRLITAKAQFLTAHFEALERLGAPSVSAPISKEDNIKQSFIFTPESEINEQEADEQPVYDEIVEVEISNDVIEEEERNYNEEVSEDAFTTEEKEQIIAESDLIEETESVEEEIVEKSEESHANVAAQETIEEEQSTPPQESNLSTPSSYQTQYTTPQPEPVAESRFEPVVNEVVEEKREVRIEHPPIVKQEEEPLARPLTINELIQQQKKAGLTNANQFNTSSNRSEQILDLKTGVSLNDKLLFIKDLFNGYSLAYSEAIELLNRFDNFSDADAFLQANYALKNNWASKPQTVDKLYTVLRKKFG